MQNKTEGKKTKLNFLLIELQTDKQARDIAGTKLKKFFELVKREIKSEFILKDTYFRYNGGNTGFGHIIARPKKR